MTGIALEKGVIMGFTHYICDNHQKPYLHGPLTNQLPSIPISKIFHKLQQKLRKKLTRTQIKIIPKIDELMR